MIYQAKVRNNDKQILLLVAIIIHHYYATMQQSIATNNKVSADPIGALNIINNTRLQVHK
jgi:hypothetical protein